MIHFLQNRQPHTRIKLVNPPLDMRRGGPVNFAFPIVGDGVGDRFE